MSGESSCALLWLHLSGWMWNCCFYLVVSALKSMRCICYSPPLLFFPSALFSCFDYCDLFQSLQFYGSNKSCSNYQKTSGCCINCTLRGNTDRADRFWTVERRMHASLSDKRNIIWRPVGRVVLQPPSRSPSLSTVATRSFIRERPTNENSRANERQRRCEMRSPWSHRS